VSSRPSDPPRPSAGAAPTDEAELLAVSVGLPREASWRGEAVRTGIFKAPVSRRVAVGPHGIAGDGQADLAVHGGIDKAVYAYDFSNTAYWRGELARPELGFGSFGENLTVAGLPDAQVCIGDRFRIGTACFEVSQPRQPCSKLGLRFDDATFPKRFLASRRVGYYLRVLEAGEIGAGDPIRRIGHASDRLDVASLVAIFTAAGRTDRAVLERVVALTTLADAWRTPLRERLAALDD
jgi:MOSC domain-containing protein YiiM